MMTKTKPRKPGEMCQSQALVSHCSTEAMLWNTKSNQCVECLWPSGAYTQRCIDMGSGSWVHLQSVNALTSVTVQGSVVPRGESWGCSFSLRQGSSALITGTKCGCVAWLFEEAAAVGRAPGHTVLSWNHHPMGTGSLVLSMSIVRGHLGALWCWQNWVFLSHLPWEWQRFPAYVMRLRYFSHSVFSESLFPRIAALEETLETRNFGALDGYCGERKRECHKEKSGVTNSAMKVKTLKKLLSCYKTPKVLALKINFRWE